MGTGWRRAFCTTAPRGSIDRDPREIPHLHHNHDQEQEHQQQQQISDPQSPAVHCPSPSPRSCVKLGFFSGGINPSTPRRTTTITTTATTEESQPQTKQQPPFFSSNDTPKLQCKTNEKTTKLHHGSNPTSPRSPFSILKNTLRLSRNVECGVCLQSAKTGQGMAIYTAECSHAFHFPCIASHVRKQGSLVCPVCSLAWKDVPLLFAHKNLSSSVSSPRTPTTAGSSPRIQTHSDDKKIFKLKKSYNDDEPLFFSPKAGARFTSIPEEEAEEEDVDDGVVDDDDFEFVVNPTTPSSIRKKIDEGKSVKNVEVKLQPEAAVISVGRTHQTFAVALTVKTPANTDGPILAPSLSRAPIDLVTVLDISGDMAGEKLEILKGAMRRLIVSSLGSADRLSIVAFSLTSQRLLPLRRMTAHGQRTAQRIVNRLVCGDAKCGAAEALRKASKVLEDRRERNPVASVVLLSAGQDEKINNHQRLLINDNTVRFAHIEIPVRCGVEPAEEMLARQMGAVLSVVVQDLRIQLGLASGSAPAEITAVYYSSHGRPALMSADSVRVGDMYAEEEREILMEMKVPTSAIGSHHVMSVRCSYRDPSSQDLLIHCRERALLVPRPHAVRSADPRIERLRRQFLSTRAVAESRRLVDHGELTSALHLLSSARAVLIKNGSGSGSGRGDEFIKKVEAAEAELKWKRESGRKEQGAMQVRSGGRRVAEVVAGFVDENGEPLTPTSAWRAAERLAKVAIMKKSLNKVSDLHGFENARF